MKKKVLLAVLTLVLLLAQPLTALADVIIEPFDDFYMKHSSECVYVGRTFIANGPDGSVPVRTEPGAGAEIVAIPNGDAIYVSHTYDLNGKPWGVVLLHAYVEQEQPAGPEGENDELVSAYEPTGWLPMEQMRLKYDYISFQEDHADEFYAYTGSYDKFINAKKIVFWTWPGSGEVAWVNDGGVYAEYFRFSHVYKDAQGREWGFPDDRSAAWICIDDPENENLPAAPDNPPTGVWQMEPPGNHRISVDTLLVVLVCALVAGTVILIRVFWKPAKREK